MIRNYGQDNRKKCNFFLARHSLQERRQDMSPYGEQDTVSEGDGKTYPPFGEQDTVSKGDGKTYPLMGSKTQSPRETARHIPLTGSKTCLCCTL